MKKFVLKGFLGTSLIALIPSALRLLGARFLHQDAFYISSISLLIFSNITTFSLLAFPSAIERLCKMRSSPNRSSIYPPDITQCIAISVLISFVFGVISSFFWLGDLGISIVLLSSFGSASFAILTYLSIFSFSRYQFRASAFYSLCLNLIPIGASIVFSQSRSISIIWVSVSLIISLLLVCFTRLSEPLSLFRFFTSLTTPRVCDNTLHIASFSGLLRSFTYIMSFSWPLQFSSVLSAQLFAFMIYSYEYDRSGAIVLSVVLISRDFSLRLSAYFSRALGNVVNDPILVASPLNIIRPLAFAILFALVTALCVSLITLYLFPSLVGGNFAHLSSLGSSRLTLVAAFSFESMASSLYIIVSLATAFLPSLLFISAPREIMTALSISLLSGLGYLRSIPLVLLIYGSLSFLLTLLISFILLRRTLSSPSFPEYQF
jgi:hypothetical protein